MKRHLIIAALCLATINAHAQRISATATTIDVGATGFEIPVTATFDLRNKSNKPLIIKEVKADCGCINIGRPTKNISPNERFNITVTYDAKMLGHFTKQVAVYSNASEKPVYLTMKGTVLEELQDFSSKYPHDINGLMVDVDELEFDDVKKGDHPERVVNVLNNTSAVVIPNLLHLPPYLTAVASPEQLSPGRAGKITVTLNSEKVHNYGLTQANIYLARQLGEKISNKTLIPVSVILIPDISKYKGSNKQYAPHMVTSANEIKLGIHDGKKVKSGTISITNNGRTNLDISALQMFTSGLKVTLEKRELMPGEQTKMTVKGDRSKLLKARTKPRILMITNDPDHPKVIITVNVK